MEEIKKRSFIKYFLLSMVTCGIYGIVENVRMGKDVNTICQGDGKEQMNWFFASLLGLVTLGIYPLYWMYTAMERLKDNAYRYGAMIRYDGTDYLLWYLLGSLIFVGPLVGMYHYMDDINQYSQLYSTVQAAPYTQNYNERMNLKPKPLTQAIANEQYVDNGNVVNNTPYQPVNYYQQSIQKPVIDPTGPTDGYGQNSNKRGKIIGLTGMYAGANIQIVNGETIVIGKDPARSNIILDDNYVSSVHCSIKYDAIADCYIVTDSSTNGTYTDNGKKLVKYQPTRINYGCVLYIANKQNAFKLN